MNPRIDKIRQSVADYLEAIGHGNRRFIQDIREGRQDNGPFMTGALAWDAAYPGKLTGDDSL